jgi:drug/metabolite transporter (DMT)-like permease
VIIGAGILWGVASAFGFAVYQLSNRWLVHKASIYRTTFLSLLISSFFSALIVLLLEEPEVWESLNATAVLWFSLSGFIHFSLGWNLLGLSQRIIGAAKASPLVSSSVVLSALFAPLFFPEPLSIALFAGIILLMVGVVLISKEQGGTAGVRGKIWPGIIFGLLTGACFAASPIPFRFGYSITPSALIAVWISLTAGMVFALFSWLINENEARRNNPTAAVKNKEKLKPLQFWLIQVLSGLAVGGAIIARWISLVYLPIVHVNALLMLTIPTVVLVAPLVFSKKLEQFGWKLWLGTLIILGGLAVTVFMGV